MKIFIEESWFSVILFIVFEVGSELWVKNVDSLEGLGIGRDICFNEYRFLELEFIRFL